MFPVVAMVPSEVMAVPSHVALIVERIAVSSAAATRIDAGPVLTVCVHDIVVTAPTLTPAELGPTLS